MGLNVHCDRRLKDSLHHDDTGALRLSVLPVDTGPAARPQDLTDSNAIAARFQRAILSKCFMTGILFRN